MTRRITLLAIVAAAGALAAAQGAAASWLQQSTPNPAGAKTWQLAAVSCSSATACTAVGSSTDSAGTHPLVERRSGNSWTIQSIPLPAGAATVELNAVACASATACVAVGDYAAGTDTVTLAEAWNGSSWTVQATPNPAGATSSTLRGISCASPTACIAVGDSSNGTDTLTLAEAWNGGSWTILPTVDPTTTSELAGVSCTSPTACVAVGDDVDGTNTVTLAEVWNGSGWTRQATPNPTGSTVSRLEGVSCTAANACTAVGPELAERWNGTSWSLQQLARPPRADTGAELSRVSCTSATACTAVGGFFNSEAILTLVAEAWNGTVWRVQPTPLSTAADSSLLNDVSCFSPTACTAAGSYLDPVTGNRALVEVAALRWQLDFPAVPSGALASSLSGVSCPSVRACMAVGGLESGPGTFETTSESWDGQTWTIEATPNPTVSNLSAVSCTAPTACTAVGDFLSGGKPLTLAERWDGASWTVQATPNPTGATRSFLTAVSCSSPSACTATGFFFNHAGTQLTLAEAWNGIGWAIQPTPNPSGATTSQLNGVSCASAAFCVAAGQVVAGTSGLLVEAWNGTSWALQSAPMPAGGSDGYLAGVSCTSPSACTAAGDDFDGAHLVPLAERWNGTAWTAEPGAVPPGTASGLKSVSCAAFNTCTAVGWLTRGGTNLPLAERWNGTSWAVQPVPTVSGAQGTVLAGVSCPYRLECMGVGYDTDSSGTETVFGALYS